MRAALLDRVGRRSEGGASQRSVEPRPRARSARQRAAVFGKAVAGELASRTCRIGEPTLFTRRLSYVRVGGALARERLAEPLGDTLFFAGEATDREEAGTVAGACAADGARRRKF